MPEYVVSARKYRPESFATLIGQEVIARTLKNSIQRGKIAHAYLFCGPRGVGKTTTARIFAKAINCSNLTPDIEPCGQCESCRSFAEGRSYCIHELDAASNNGVDDIKALLEQVQIPPQVGRYSVYIIDEVHMLSQAAFNAFLKTLEEPPAHAVFILATTEKHKIIPTILSRCQTYDFNRISIPDIVGNLREIAAKEGVNIDDESLHIIARKADGAMRDALTIFDQTVAFCGTDVQYKDVMHNLNVLDYEYSFTLVDAFLSKDYARAMLTFDEILAKGFNALHFVLALSSHLRDLIVSKTAGLESLLDLPKSLQERYAAQAEKCSLKFLYNALSVTVQCEAGYRSAVNPRLHIEYALMRLCFMGEVPEAPAAAAQTKAAQEAAATAPQDASGQSAAAGTQNAAGAREAAVTPEAVATQEAAGRQPSSPAEIAQAPAEKLVAKPVQEPTEKPAPKLSDAPKDEAAQGAADASKSVEEQRHSPEKEPSNAPQDAVEQPSEPRPRARKAVKAISYDSIVADAEGSRPESAAPSADDTPVPPDETIKDKWKDLVAKYSAQPRLHSALENARLSISPEESGEKVLTFEVSNSSQCSWIKEHRLRQLETAYQEIIGSSKVRLGVHAADVVTQDRPYTDEEKIHEMMKANPEVRNLVTDLHLDL